MGWPFWKTYTVRCGDGRVKTVYRNVDDAFPMYIPGWNTSLAAGAKAPDSTAADIKAEYSTAVHGLLIGLDELNHGLMMTFRAAYIVYKNDPCQHGDFFEREVEKLLEEQRRLRTLKVQIDGLIQLAKLQPDHSREFARVYGGVIDRMGSPLVPQTPVQDAIREARETANKMKGRRDED
jgi:hypothetical protein